MNDTEGNLHPERIKNPEVNYEPRDLSARAVFIFLLALAITAVFAHFILWGMFRSFGHGNVTPQPRTAGIPTVQRALPRGEDPALSFPAPQLQPDPPADLDKFRTQEEQVLNSYDFVDKDKGVVRIPIDRAMQLTLQRGLPTRAPGQPVPAAAPTGTGQPGNAGGAGGTEPRSKQ